MDVKTGKLDVLDAPGDHPKRSEMAYDYRRVTEPTSVHINGRKIKGFFACAEYEWIEPA